MRLRPALIMLGVFIIVIGGLALFVSMYEAPTTDELATLKDRPLFPDVTPAAVRKVEIISPKIGEKPMIIARTGGRKWQMTSPVTALASDRKISRVLQAFVRMKAARGHRTRSFVDYDLDKPKLRVTLTSRTGEVTTVAFGVDVELAPAPRRTWTHIPSTNWAAPGRPSRTGMSASATRTRCCSSRTMSVR